MRQRLFYDWLNPKFDIWILIFMGICMGFTSGASMALSYMIPDLAIDPTISMMCIYSYTAGIAMSFAVFPKLRDYLNTKEMLIGICILLICFNYILSETDSPAIIVSMSFLIGCVRLLGSMMIVINLMPILMPNGQRFQLYAVYYPISFATSPLSNYLQALLADRFGWHESLNIANILLFLILIIVILLVPYKAIRRRIPLWKFDWFGFLMMAGWMLSFVYVLTYGKALAWFNSQRIIIALITLAFCLFALSFQHFILHPKLRLLNFTILKERNARVGLIIIFFFGIFYAMSTPLSAWMNIAFHNNPIERAHVNTYPIYGYILGALICFLYYRKFDNFKNMLILVILCYLSAAFWFYSIIDQQTSALMMFGPLVLRAMGIIISYITVSLYLAMSLKEHYRTIILIFIFIRSFLTSVVFGSLYANWMYYRPTQLMVRLASWTDSNDALFISHLRNAHVSSSDAMSAYKLFKTQATLAATKELLGLICIAGVIMFIILLYLPIYKKLNRHIFTWTKYDGDDDAAETVVV